jgi:hypothetical protein
MGAKPRETGEAVEACAVKAFLAACNIASFSLSSAAALIAASKAI